MVSETETVLPEIKGSIAEKPSFSLTSSRWSVFGSKTRNFEHDIDVEHHCDVSKSPENPAGRIREAPTTNQDAREIMPTGDDDHMELN